MLKWNDVIASCAFGIKVNSLKNPDNEFFTAGKKLLSFAKPTAIFKFLLITAFPSFSQKIGIDLIDKDVQKFFRSMVLETMVTREEKKILRPDMINILMQVRKGTITTQSDEEHIASANEACATVDESIVGRTVNHQLWTDNQIIAQCFLFFFAGFDTTSNLLTTVAYELIANPDIQQKLYAEIRASHDNRHGMRIDYDTLQKMKYMDMVVMETPKRWPPTPAVHRICVKNYSFDDGITKLDIKKNTSRLIPIYSIQHDPQYYPDPDRFDPVRFSA